MWELNLKYEQTEQNIINNLKSFLSNKSDIIIAEKFSENYSCFGIACMTEQIKIEDFLSVLSTEIINQSKFNYFSKYIKYSNVSQSLNDNVIKALVQFDVDSDVLYCYNKIIDLKNIVIKSFVEFSLRELFEKWEEFIVLSSIKITTNCNSQLLLNFLKYIVESLPTKDNVLSILSESNNFTFKYDDKTFSIEHSLLNDDLLISKLIEIKPTIIKLDCKEIINTNSFKDFYFLYNNRII